MARDSNLAERFLQGLGLVECSLAEVEQRFATYRRGPTSGNRVVGISNDPHKALAYLSTLTIPHTRHVLFAVGDSMTATVNNELNGSDYADEVCHLPRHFGCRFARVLNCPQRIWRRGQLREVQQYGVRLFDLHDAQGDTVRSICCMNDGGRWVYHSHGLPHSVEATFGADSARTSARFPVEQLAAVAAGFGFSLPTPDQFHNAGRYVMFAQERHVIRTCTIAKADDPAYGYYTRGLGYAKHLATHAASVVANFERCLAINANYEPQVRELLNEARRQLDAD